MIVQFDNPNTSFSKTNSFLQLAVDSTSLKAFKECPRKYYYSIVLGYQTKTESVHLTFGLLMHGSLERYHHAKAAGKDHDDSLDAAVDWALKMTWMKELQRPWNSGDSYKNRFTLIRTLIGYLDKYGANDNLETVILSNGKPAVELSFSFNSGFASKSTSESFMFSGHLDRLALLNGAAYIPDTKTTKSDLNARYWSSHDPSTQFSMYLLAGQIVYKLPVQGLIVDAARVLVNSSEFSRHLITKDSFQMDEFYNGTGRWLARMEESAIEGKLAFESSGGDFGSASQGYEMNEESCSKYSGCDFQQICSRSPYARKNKLEQDYKKRVWDPLQRRGDI